MILYISRKLPLPNFWHRYQPLHKRKLLMCHHDNPAYQIKQIEYIQKKYMASFTKKIAVQYHQESKLREA